MKVSVTVAALALALAGCQSIENAALQVVAPNTILVNNALASVAKNNLPQACATIKVAEGYYADVQFLIPQPAQIAEAAAASIVNGICRVPPTNIVAAFATLNKAWATIQAATTVPK